MIRAARLRLTASYAAIVLAILLILGSAAYLTMRATLLAAIDRDVRLVVEGAADNDGSSREESDLQRIVRRDHPAVFVLVVATDGRVVSNASGVDAHELQELVGRGALDAALSGRAELRTVDVDDRPYRTYAAPKLHDGRVSGVIIGGRSLSAYERDLRLLLTVLGATGVAGVALAILGGYVFAGRSLAPIDAAYERQRRFVGDASHELRSPLAVIRASADLLLRESLTESHRESAEEIRDTAIEASALVDDLLALARLDHESPTGSAERSDLDTVVSEVLAQLEGLLEAHGSPVTVRLDAIATACPAPVVRRLVRALVENVIAHTPKGTPLEVSASRAGPQTILCVRDHGPGIPENSLDDVFERFTRMDAARTPGTGTGLGLAIVAALVRRYRGRVTARNHPTGGLEVEVRLPAA